MGTGMLLALTGVVIVLAAWLLDPPLEDLASLCVFLLASGGLSLGLVLAVLHTSLGNILRTLRGKLIFALVLSAALTAANIGFTAYLMFISSHDLKLLSLLVLFSLGMSALFAVAVSRSFHSGLEDLLDAVRSMGAGNLNSRATITSGDELDEVGRAFNVMADRLEGAFARQRDQFVAARNGRAGIQVPCAHGT